MSSVPDTSLLQEMEARAREWARGAGDILLEHFQRPLEVEFKGKGRRSPVTAADRAAQAYLKQAIQRTYPSHGFLAEEAEETAGSDSDFLWVVDPLDGTTNFINRLSIFAVSIGVLYRGRPVVGCIFTPFGPQLKGSAFHCHRGGGAFQEGQPISMSAGLSPRKLASLPSHYILFSKPTKELRQSLGDVRSLGSIAYDMALVATGSLHIAMFGAPRLWDVAAGVLLVREAGGEVLAIQRGHRSHGWEPLVEFVPPLGKKEGQGLAGWSALMIAGSQEEAWFLARNLRQRGFLSRLLLKWL